jgi:hypothetical protein
MRFLITLHSKHGASVLPGIRRRLLMCAIVSDLEEGPHSTVGFVDPILDQARRGNITVLTAQTVHSAQAHSELDIVLAQLGQHGMRRQVVRIVVLHALQSGDMSD